MASEARQKRVGELIREETAKMIHTDLKDPRIGFVSIMSVRMSPDLRYANIYVSTLGSDAEKKSSLIGLRRSAGWVRREIGKRLRLRFTPEVRFFEDTSLDDVFHLEEMFKQIHDDEAMKDAEDANEHD